MNKKGEVDFGELIGPLLILLLIVGGFVMFALYIVDEVYIRPTVDDKANKWCQEQGYDFYDSYSRVGILSKEPLAIRCKYVEQYRKIDITKIEKEKE